VDNHATIDALCYGRLDPAKLTADLERRLNPDGLAVISEAIGDAVAGRQPVW
jgi:hypothetical protein